jgi:hypothetical protein
VSDSAHHSHAGRTSTSCVASGDSANPLVNTQEVLGGELRLVRDATCGQPVYEALHLIREARPPTRFRM